MREKKTQGRFTIQFNMEDPQQREASAYIERQGRRKSQFLTNAVLFYLQQGKETTNVGTIPLSLPAMEGFLLNLIAKGIGVGENAQPESERNQNPVSGEPEVPLSDTPAEPVDYSALSNTLQAFDKY